MLTRIKTTFRAAEVSDGLNLARLMHIASDGVCNYIWHLQQAEFPHLTPLEIGAQRYAEGDGNFSYQNCVVAVAGHENPRSRQPQPVQGMMMSFGISAAADDASKTELSTADDDPAAAILAPYALEQPNSWYICALGIFPEYRRQGIGTQFLELAAEQAHEHGFATLSLLCFEQNVGALKLYRRHGFRVVEQTPVVPHPLIHFTGNLLLMTKPV